MYGCVLFFPSAVESADGQCQLAHDFGHYLLIVALALPCLCCCALPAAAAMQGKEAGEDNDLEAPLAL